MGKAVTDQLQVDSTITIAGEALLKPSVLLDGYLHSGDTVGGDLSGTYLNPVVAALTETGGPTSLILGNVPDGYVLQRSGSSLIGVEAAGVGVNDHGGLTGLDDDDHIQYFNAPRLESVLDGYTTDAEFTAHTGDVTIHFTEASIDHGSIAGLSDDDHPQYYNDSRIESLLDGYTTDAEFSAHTGDSTIHFTEASIDHGSVAGLSDDDHPQYLLVDGTRAMSGTLDVGNNQVINMAIPTSDQDGATKAYVDSVAAGLDIKESVVAASTANITISGLQTIDGISVQDGYRILVKNQITQSENGIYVASTSAWVRPLDASDGYLTSGAFTFVEQGSINEGSGWVLVTKDPITVGVTNLTWTRFSGTGQITAGDGLTKTGNTLNVVANVDGSIIANADNIQVGVLATNAQHGVRGGGTQHAEATPSTAGFLSAADKTKLNSLESILDGYTTDTEFASHTGDATIHFTEAGIDHGSIAGLVDDDHPQYFNSARLESVLDGYTTDAELTAHTGDATIHFTEASIDHGNISGLGDDDHPQYYNNTRIESLLDGYTTDTEFTAHTGDSTIHFTEASIDHGSIAGLSGDDHPQYYNDSRIETLLDGYTTDTEFSSHTGDATIHFTEASIDHGSISGLEGDDHPQYFNQARLEPVLDGYTTDAEFAAHTGDTTIHFTEASIDHGNIAGLGDDDHTQYYNSTRLESVLDGYTTDAELTAHTGDATIHFTEASIDHGSIAGLGDDDHPQYYNDSRLEAVLDGYTTDAEFTAHTGDATIHFTEASIDHGSIGGLGDDDHPQYYNDARIELLLDGYTTDAELSGHTGDSSIHFTEGSIDHGSITGLGDDDHTQYFNTARLDLVVDGYIIGITVEDEGSAIAGTPHTTFNFVGAGVTAVDAGGGETTITIPGGSSDHGALTGLGDDDHPQYYNDSRIEPLLDGYTTDAEFSSHTGDSSIHFTEGSIDHGSIAGLGDDDHTQYLLADGTRSVSGNLLPVADDLYDLGSNSFRWRDGYFSSSTLHVGSSLADEGTLSYNTSTNDFEISSTGAVSVTSNFDAESGLDVSGAALTTSLGITNTFGEVLIFGGNLQLNDNIALTMGTSDDLSISHDSVNSIISNGTGSLQINGAPGSEVIFNEAGNNTDLRVEGDTEANLLFVDASTDRVGFGTATPATLLEVRTDQNTNTAIRVRNASTGTAGQAQIQVTNSASSAYFRVFSTGFTPNGLDQPNTANFTIDSTLDGLYFYTPTASKPIIWGTNNLERFRITDAEAVLNDPGNDVDFRVAGDTRPNLLLVDGGTDRVGINRAAGTHGATLDVDNLAVAESILILRDNGSVAFEVGDDHTAVITEGDFIIKSSGTGAASIANLRTWNDQVGVPSELRFRKSHTDTIDTNVATIDGTRFGDIIFDGVNSAPSVQSSASICVIQDGTAGGGTTRLPTNIVFEVGDGVATTMGEVARFGYDEVVFNENGDDIDFRVEGDTRPNLLLIDAGTDRVGINRAAGTHGATLDVDNLAVAESILTLRDNGTTVFTVADGGAITQSSGGGTWEGSHTFNGEVTADGINVALDGYSNYNISRAAASTTDGYAITLQTIATASDAIYYIRAEISGRRTGGAAGAANDSAVYIREARAKNNSGTLTIEDLQTTYTSEDQAAWDGTIIASGTNIIVQVTGAINNNIDWIVTTKAQGI